MKKGRKAKESQTLKKKTKKSKVQKKGTRGGRTAKDKGNRFEYRVRNYYLDRGWYSKRSWGSYGPYDVMSLRPVETKEHGILCEAHFLQCKNLAVEKELSEYEINNLKAVAKTAGGKALYAYNDSKHHIVIKEL